MIDFPERRRNWSCSGSNVIGVAGCRGRTVSRRLQALDLLSEPCEPSIQVSFAIASAGSDPADEPRELVLNPRQTGFQRGIALLTGDAARLSLADLFGNPALSLSLAADQQRNGFDEQVVLLGHVVARQIGGHRPGL
jgi:hypothetical protein